MFSEGKTDQNLEWAKEHNVPVMLILKPSQIISSGHTSNIFVKKMMDVLRRQGQIEPLQVKHYADTPDGPVYITYVQDVHGAEIVEAAIRLEWPTLLCTLTNNGKYEY